MRKLTDICPDFNDWPDRWKVVKQDLDYGKQLLEAFRPFTNSLLESGLSKKTVNKHLTNLWYLGGEIVHHVNLFNEYSIPAYDKLFQSIDNEGGPLCHHLESEMEMKSYDSTCRKLYKFLKTS